MNPNSTDPVWARVSAGCVCVCITYVNEGPWGPGDGRIKLLESPPRIMAWVTVLQAN